MGDKFPKVDIGNKFSSYFLPPDKCIEQKHHEKSNSKATSFQQQLSTLKGPNNKEDEQIIHDRIRINNSGPVEGKQDLPSSVGHTTDSMSGASRMFSLYNNLQNAAAAQAAHQAAQAVAANAGGVAPQPLPIPPPSNGVRPMGGTDGNGVENAQNRLFCHQLYERMRAVQQQQKAHETKSKPTASNSTNAISCPSSNTNKSSNTHTTYKTPSPIYGHSFINPEEDVRGIAYSRPPPLIEIDSPLKGLSKLTSSNVVAPPNAIAPSSLKLDHDSRSAFGTGSPRYTPLQMNKELRHESPP